MEAQTETTQTKAVSHKAKPENQALSVIQVRFHIGQQVGKAVVSSVNIKDKKFSNVESMVRWPEGIKINCDGVSDIVPWSNIQSFRLAEQVK